MKPHLTAFLNRRLSLKLKRTTAKLIKMKLFYNYKNYNDFDFGINNYVLLRNNGVTIEHLIVLTTVLTFTFDNYKLMSLHC